MQMRRKGLPSPFDLVTIVANLVVPPIGLSIEMDLVFDNGTRGLVPNGNVKALPAEVWLFRHWGSIADSISTGKPSAQLNIQLLRVPSHFTVTIAGHRFSFFPSSWFRPTGIGNLSPAVNLKLIPAVEQADESNPVGCFIDRKLY